MTTVRDQLMHPTHCNTCGGDIPRGEPRAMVREGGDIVSICPTCVKATFENADQVPMYSSTRDFNRKMIAKFGRE